MASKNKQFHKLPSDIQDVIFSVINPELNLEISEKYELDDENISALVDIIADLMSKDLSIDDLEARIKKDMDLGEEDIDDLAIDIVGKRLLAFDDYYDNAPSQLLRDNKVSPSRFNKDISRQKQVIEDEKRIRQEEQKVMADLDREIEPPEIKYVESDSKHEKTNAPTIFKEILLDLFIPNDNMYDVLNDYNGVLMALIEKDRGFRKSLEEAIYENQQRIGEKQINLQGKSVKPTVGNWLQDFIAENGTNIFNNVVLSNYLTKSKNTKNLSQEEKVILNKVLVTYRNIKFFPNSLAEVSPDRWGIIPLEIPAQETDDNALSTGKLLQEVTGWDLSKMTPLEIRALAEEYNMTEDQLIRKINK